MDSSHLKRHRLREWMWKQNPSFCCIQETHLEIPAGRLLQYPHTIHWTLQATSPTPALKSSYPLTTPVELWNTVCYYIERTKKENQEGEAKEWTKRGTLKHKLWLYRVNQDSDPREQAKTEDQDRSQWHRQWRYRAYQKQFPKTQTATARIGPRGKTLSVTNEGRDG